jgi:hypothetical protein
VEVAVILIVLTSAFVIYSQRLTPSSLYFRFNRLSSGLRCSISCLTKLDVTVSRKTRRETFRSRDKFDELRIQAGLNFLVKSRFCSQIVLASKYAHGCNDLNFC